jgi:NAD+ kinase
LRCIVLTPISPHMLFDRSLVFSEHDEVAFVVVNGRNVALTIDGRELGELCSGDRVRCRVAREPLRLISVRPRDFHQILKTKFSLPDR